MHVIDERNESSEWPPSLFIPETGTSPTSIASLLKSFLFVKYVAFFWKVGGGNYEREISKREQTRRAKLIRSL